MEDERLDEKKDYPKLPKVEKLSKSNGPKKGIFVVFLVVFYIFGLMSAFVIPAMGWSPDSFLTDQACDSLMNQSFINGTYYGLEYTIASITQKAIQCEKIPILYKGYNFTLFVEECLDLNLTKGGK